MCNSDFIFQVGDIISNLDKTDVRVITKLNCEDDNKCRSYSFMNLKDITVKSILNNIIIEKKGSMSEQPASVLEKYFSLYDIK